MPSLGRSSVAALVLVLAAACGGESSSPETVADVDVQPGTAEVEIGESQQFTVVVTGSGGSVLTGRPATWSSTPDATITSTGLATGVDVGQATITARVEGRLGTATLTVVPPPIVTIEVTPANDTILVGDMTQLSATARDASGTPRPVPMVWSSRDEPIATVDQDGNVTGVSPGEVVIDVTADGVTGSATIVVEARPVVQVDMSTPEDTVTVGGELPLGATPRDDTGGEADTGVEFTSDDETVATVEGPPGPLAASTRSAALVVEATVKGVAEGSTLIRAVAQGVEGVTTMVVREAVASVEVQPADVTLAIDEEVQLAATPRTAGGAEVMGCIVTWDSLDDAVASITPGGLVTGVADGTTTATADADCGKVGQAQGTADVTVSTRRDVLAVAVGGRFACALVENPDFMANGTGDVYCWGANDRGQLGDGTFVDRDVPTKVDLPGILPGGFLAGTDPSRTAGEILVAGEGHACVRATNGTTWCWGAGDQGQLGDALLMDQNAPVQVATATNHARLEAGSEYTCGSQAAGLTTCWGDNEDGQLGNGNFMDRPVPSFVNTPELFTMIRAGDDSTCGITTESETYCWGNNSHGAVGDGTVGVDLSSPHLVVPPGGSGTPIDFAWLGVGDEHVCGVQDVTGTTWCWGRNDRGQAGTVPGADLVAPRAIDAIDPVFQSVFSSGAADVKSTCGIRPPTTDPFAGILECWGANDVGQLGIGTSVDRSTPASVLVDEEFVYVSLSATNGCGVTSDFRLMCWGDDSRGQLGDGPPFIGTTTPQFVEIGGG